MKKFFKKHLRTIILFIITSLAVVHFVVNFDLIQNTKLIEESQTNLINGYILIITMLIGMIFVIWLLFLMSKETAKDLEKFLLRNLGTACFLLIMFLGFHGLLGNLEKNFTLTAIGAILVFWYGYKTYERDKELELVTNYSLRYNSIKTISSTTEPTHEDCKNLINLWFEEYFLYKRGYISLDLWNEWVEFIGQDIRYLMIQTIQSIENNFNDKIDVINELVLLDNSPFLIELLHYSHSKNDLHQTNFYKFIYSQVNNFVMVRKKFHHSTNIDEIILIALNDFLKNNS